MGQEAEHGNCANHEAMKKELEYMGKKIDGVESDHRLIVDAVGKIRERVTSVEESASSAHKRLNKIEEQTDTIVRLTVSIEQLAEQMRDALVLLKEHGDRLECVEKKPGEAAMYYVRLAIGTLVTGTVGVLIGLLFARGGGP